MWLELSHQREPMATFLLLAPLVLSVPEGVDVRKVDLSIELQILAFHAQRRSAVVRPESRRPRGAAASSEGWCILILIGFTSEYSLQEYL